MGSIEKTFEEVMRIASCPVCFERLSPEVICCVNGHAICRGCKKNLKCCPTCRNSFSAHGHTFISQLMEVLPYPCPNEGCREMFNGKPQMEEHVKLFCSHRYTECQCLWYGKVNDMQQHVESSKCMHKGNYATDTVLELHMLDPTSTLYSVKEHQGEFSVRFMCLYFDQLFFRDQIVNEAKEKITFRYICVPNEKAVNTHFVVRLEFQSDDKTTTHAAEKKLTKYYEDGVIEGSLVFNLKMLRDLTYGMLKYKFNIKKFED